MSNELRIITINEKALTPDELVEKVKSGNPLSKVEFNDFKSYVTKLSRSGGEQYQYIYGIYKQARNLIETEGYGDSTWVGTCADGSKKVSKNKDKLISLMRTY